MHDQIGMISSNGGLSVHSEATSQNSSRTTESLWSSVAAVRPNNRNVGPSMDSNVK